MAKKPGKSNSYVTTTSTGNPLYSVGATGRDVDTVGNYLVNNGYMNSYSGKYDASMQSALAQAKQDLLGPNSKNDGAYKGGTFGAATLNAIEKANQAAQENLVQQQIDAALEPYVNMTASYEQILAAQQAQFEQQQAAAQQNTQAAIDSIYSNKGSIEDAYKKAQKENYINQVLQQNQMGDYLQAAGYTGGAAESTLAALNNTYENNRQTATEERDKSFLELDKLAAQARTSGNADLANIANNYYNSYINALNNQAQMNYQIGQDRQEQANADRQYQLQLNQQQFDQQQYRDQLAREQAEKEAEKATAESIAARNNRVRANEIKRQRQGYTTENWYDERDIYHYRILSAPKATGRSSGYSGSSAGGGSSGGYSMPSYTPTTAAKNLISQITSRFPAGITPDAKGNAVLNAVKSALSQKTISSEDADYILRQFGY